MDLIYKVSFAKDRRRRQAFDNPFKEMLHPDRWDHNTTMREEVGGGRELEGGKMVDAIKKIVTRREKKKERNF